MAPTSPSRRPDDASEAGGRLLLTGGSGFLGRHVLAHPAAARWEIVAPTSSELDLRDRGTVERVVGGIRPAAVVHTAYRKDDAASVVAATRHLAAAAARAGARFVHVSSDALFTGRAAPYTEDDEPDPVHDYGRWKADAERVVADLAPGAVIVRTSLLYGRTEPSVHDLAARDAVEGRSDVAFFTDEYRSALFADDLAGVLLELARRPDLTGVLHVGGPAALSRADLARISCERFGWDATRLRYASQAEAGSVRPARVVLDSSRAAALGMTVEGPATRPTS